MVGRLPALKYFDAASSYSFHTSSTGCLQDTSACVCTSIAMRSFTFIVNPLSIAFSIPLRERTPLADQAREQGRGLPVHGTELVAIFQDAVMNGFQADRIRM